MCGITGFNFRTNNKSYLKVAAHRGPDNTSEVEVNEFTFAHNRLSIIDLSESAHQPFWSHDRKYLIIFNGEIFNYKQVREKLEPKYHFRTNSDTEVILYNYIEKKEKCLDDLTGMFAFAIYDTENDSVFAARDRLGIKPFHYYHQNGKFIFSSELKVIKEILGGGLTVNTEAIMQYLRYLYVPYPSSAFEEIKKLPPGHYLYFRKNGIRISCYWDINNFTGRRKIAEEDAASELDDLLNDAVKLRMISDVPLGLFLSGGMDSGTILYYMSRNSSGPVKTFTLGFPGAKLYDEKKDAGIMAHHFGTIHTEIDIDPKITELLPKMVFHFDEPFGNPTSLLIHELTKETKKHATVALAGDGGDEIMGGYPRYEAALLYDSLKYVPRPLFRLAGLLTGMLPESSSGDHRLRRLKTFTSSLSKVPSDMYEDWVSYFSDNEIKAITGRDTEYDHVVKQAFLGSAARDMLLKASVTDLKTFLPDNLLTYGDRMSMANAFEVRVPLIDHRIVEFMTSIDTGLRIKSGNKKYLLKKIMKDRIPAEIIEKPKLGLNPPMGLWLKNDLGAVVNDYLGKESIERRGFLNYNFIQKMLKEHESGRRDRSLHIWSLIVLEEWFRQNNVQFRD